MLLSMEVSNEECELEVFTVRRPSMDVLSYIGIMISFPFAQEGSRGLTVRRSPFSRYPRFDPAKTQSKERINATRDKRRGTTAVGRIAVRCDLEAGLVR